MNFFGFISAKKLGDGRKVVETAGSREKLVASETPCAWVVLVAFKSNTGTIVVGGNTVVAASATQRGGPLNKGDSIGLNISDLNEIYLDATVSGEGATFIYGY